MTGLAQRRIPPADLQAFVESEARNSCFTHGCTTCGGNSGAALIDQWILKHTRPETEARVADLAAALDRAVVTEASIEMLHRLVQHLRRKRFRRVDRDRIGEAVRNHPKLAEALERLRGRIDDYCEATGSGIPGTMGYLLNLIYGKL
ncbi:MAG: hypothetical protein ACK4Z0_07755 [Sphingomonadaceae bacterium]